MIIIDIFYVNLWHRTHTSNSWQFQYNQYNFNFYHVMTKKWCRQRFKKFNFKRKHLLHTGPYHHDSLLHARALMTLLIGISIKLINHSGPSISSSVHQGTQQHYLEYFSSYQQPPIQQFSNAHSSTATTFLEILVEFDPITLIAFLTARAQVLIVDATSSPRHWSHKYLIQCVLYKDVKCCRKRKNTRFKGPKRIKMT